MGPAAAIGAAGDADAKALAFEPPALEPRRNRRDDVALHPLRLGQCQAAARPGRAGEGPAVDRQQVLAEAHAMPTQRRGDAVAVRGADLAEDDVLARHQDRVAAEPLDD